MLNACYKKSRYANGAYSNNILALIQLAYFGEGKVGPRFLHCASRELMSGAGGEVKLFADLTRRRNSRSVDMA